MRNWKQAIITQIVKWLTLLLPEGCQADIFAFQQQLELEQQNNTEIQLEILKVVKDAYIGLLKSIPTNLITFLEKLNPNYWTIHIYGTNYYPQALAQVETEFLKDHYNINHKPMQISGIALIIFYMILGVLDIWCLPEVKVTAWLIKLFVCSILFFTSYLAFCPILFSKYNQQIISFSLVTAVLGIILCMSLSHIDELGYHTYYGALLLIIFYIFLNSGLRFFNALIVSTILLFGYGVMNYVSQSTILDLHIKNLRYFNNYFFLISSLIAGASASNLLERTIRLNFLIRYTISNSFLEFLNFFEYNKPEQFFENISKILISPKILEKFLHQSFVSVPNTNILYYEEGFLSKNKSLFKLPIKLKSEIKEAKIKSSKKYNPIMLFKKFLDSTLQFVKCVFLWIQDINLTFIKKHYCSDYQKRLKKIETLFRIDYLQSSLISIRFASIYAFLFYGLFGLADIFCLPETKFVSIPIRIVVCITAMIWLLTSFFEKIFKKFNQIIIVLVILMASGGIICMIASSRPTELGYTTYYAGLILVMFYIFLFSRLLFLNAMLVALFIVVGYGIIAVIYQNSLSSFKNTELFINNTIFLAILCVVGSIACYLFEQNSRLDFLTRYTIAYKAQELLAYYEHTNPTPKELLDMINGIRHSPRKLQEFLTELLAFQGSKSGKN